MVEQIEKKAKEEEAMLSEIEEGHESQASESESCETLSEPGQASVDGEEYDQRLFEIDEIIRLAQNNVEKFDKTKPGYEGVQLKDIVSADSSQADRTPSLGREEGDADSLEEAQLPELDLDHPTTSSSSAKRDIMTVSADSIEATSKSVPRDTSQDSLERVAARTSDPMATSVDSIDPTSRIDPLTTSTDSLEGPHRRHHDPMTGSTDSMDPVRRDIMASSIDSLGRDESSGMDADVSSSSEYVRPLPRDGLMECSLDSLEPTSSQATHATYQYDTDSVMSGSFTSGCSNTLMTSRDDFPDLMTSSIYMPEGELPSLEGEATSVHTLQSSDGSVATEVVSVTGEPGFSHKVTRMVRMPPEAHQVTFTGPDAQKKLEAYVRDFSAGQQSTQEEMVDGQGNVHVRRVTQTRVVADPGRAHDMGLGESGTVESEVRDDHGNVTRVVRRTVVTSHTIEVDLDTGEPIVQSGPAPSSSDPTSSSTSRTSTSGTSSPSFSRIPPTSDQSPSGPPICPPGRVSLSPPSLEPNTVSGLGEEELRSLMEIDGSDPFTTSTTHVTRIVRRTKVGEDGEVKEEEEVYEEY